MNNNLCMDCIFRYNRCQKLRDRANKAKNSGECISKNDGFDYIEKIFSCDDFESSLSPINSTIDGIEYVSNENSVVCEDIGKEISINGKDRGIIIGPLYESIDHEISEDNILIIKQTQGIYAINLDTSEILKLEEINYEVVL